MSADCPSSEELHKFAAALPGDDGVLSRHVAECPECGSTVARLRGAHESPAAHTAATVTATRTLTAGAPAPSQVDVPQVVGAVDVLRRIGRGGMGVVHLGRDRLLGRDVAVKFLLNAVAGEDDPRFEEFLAGARNAAKVRHPNLVALHQATLVNDMPCLLMEYVDGPTLRDVLHHHRTLKPALAVRILKDAASAVATLHENGTIHRDIKPSNILFDGEGRLYVTDFGLSCARPRDSDDRSMRVSGSPPYMAPEMFEGEISPRSDVYALGMMLYELLTGAAPFMGSFTEVRVRHESEPVPLESLERKGVSAKLIECIERALHKRDLFRFKTAREMIRALDTCGVTPANDLDMQRCVLACRDAGTVATGSEHTPGSSGLPSYFDRLTELASARQGARPEGDDRPIGPVMEEDQRDDVVLDHLPCARCGRDLLGVPIRELCPSCGAPVSGVLGGYLLRSADPGWLRRVARGASTLAMVLTIGPAARVLIEAASLFIPSWRVGSRSGSTIAPWFHGVLWGTVTALIVLAAFDAGSREGGKPRLLGGAARICAVLSALMLAAFFVTRAWGVAFAPTVLRALHAPTLLLTVVLVMVRLRSVAARVPAARLARAMAAAWVLVFFSGLLNVATDWIGGGGAAEFGADRLAAALALFTGVMLLCASLWTAALLRQLRALLAGIGASPGRLAG